MTNVDIEQLMATQSHSADRKGDITRDEVLKQELLRQIVYTQSGSISVGTEIVPVQQMNQLGVRFAMPGETTADYPVSNDTQGERRYIEWTQFDIRLERAIARYFVSDGAKLEGMIEPHMNAMSNRTSEALARRKDENIIGRVGNGAPESADSHENHQLDADEPWTDPELSDIPEDLRRMWERLLVNARVNSLNLTNMPVLVPARAYVQMSRLQMFNNIQQSIEEYLGQQFQFNFLPHKVGMHWDDQVMEKHGFNPQDRVIMLIPGEDTAVHGELSQSAAAAANVPLVEGPIREAQRGEDYFITQWFETSIMEFEGWGEGVTPRIVTLDGVNEHADDDLGAMRPLIEDEGDGQTGPIG